MKYAIMVCIDPDNDDWLYITEGIARDACAWPNVVTFDDLESAENYAITWRLEGKADMVKVVKYES